MAVGTGLGSDRITLAAFGLMVIGIGGNVVAVKYVLREPGQGPMWAAASRFLVATLLFAVIARVVRAPVPRGRALLGAVLYGALAFGAFFGFTYWGLQDLPASLVGVVFAMVPLLTFLLALLHRQERFRWSSVAGAALVVVGTVVILGFNSIPGGPFMRLVAVFGAAVAAAEAGIIVKGFPPVHPAMMNTIGMAVGTVILFMLMPLFNESVQVPNTTSTWIAQLYLVTMGSIGVFGLYLFVLKTWTASAASYEFVIAPVFAILFSAWFLDEKITATFLLGSVFVIAGVYFGALRHEAQKPQEP